LGSYLREPISEIRDRFPGKRLIIYQLEPLVDDHWWSPDYIMEILKEVDEVWDYDIENANKIGSHSIPVKYRPFLYSESLKRINNIQNPDIDVLFYGTLNDRRMNIINSFLRPYFSRIKFVFLSNFLESELDEFIGRSKIILNLNAHDNDKQKQSRIFYAVINNKCVVSEKSRVNYFDDLIKESDLMDLPDLIMNLLESERWRDYSNCSHQYKEMCSKGVPKINLPGVDFSFFNL
jgi:hypothetical protein